MPSADIDVNLQLTDEMASPGQPGTEKEVLNSSYVGTQLGRDPCLLATDHAASYCPLLIFLTRSSPGTILPACPINSV